MVEMVLVTGGSGFLGKNLQEAVLSSGFEWCFVSSKQVNLLEQIEVTRLLDQYRPTVLLHMAAICGGIGANKNRPADFVHLNSRMTCNVFQAAQNNGIEYLYTLGSVCAYPKHCPVPFKEDDIWNGYPEDTNAPYGTAKRLQLVMQQAYREQYGIKGAHLVPVNLFGPHDHFDLKNSHVIPALIRKIIYAKENQCESVEIWGSGNATREFLYAGDCATALVKVIESKLDYPSPTNLGTGRDISIKNLAELIAKLVEYNGELVYLGDNTDGQPKRRLDVSRAKQLLEFEATTSLEDGLGQTIDWYRKHRDKS